MEKSISGKDFKTFFESCTNDCPKNIILEATVPTGMEKIAILELIDKLNLDKNKIVALQGRIYFSTDIDKYDIVKSLRSVDNINLVSHYIPETNFTNNKEIDLQKIKDIAEEYNLLNSVEIWHKLTEAHCNIRPLKEEHDVAKIHRQDLRSNSENKTQTNNNVLKYRVTCNRSFTHSFSSVEAQHKYGGIINDKYFWVVALDDFDLNIILYIVGDSILICLKLTQVSLHNRCLIEFGPTSLRPTIAYNMLRLCQIKPGDVVMDPLCGGGSIPIEATLGYPYCFICAGDINTLAVNRCKKNVDVITPNLIKPDVFYWDAENLPLPDNSVDVICTDLPFGKRSGSNTDIRLLYKNVLKEFKRIIKQETGRICILVHKAHKVISMLNKGLFIDRKVTINVGGLKCYVFLLKPVKC